MIVGPLDIILFLWSATCLHPLNPIILKKTLKRNGAFKIIQTKFWLPMDNFNI
jgi:hypothetical protein